MAFSIFKKDDSETPPDVGREEEYEAEQQRDSNAQKEETAEEEEPSEPENMKSYSPSSNQANSSMGEMERLEIEKLNAKLESMYNWMKEFYGFFSGINERIGEIRAMNLDTEKQISKLAQDSAKAIDIVNEVEPGKLRIDYKKIEMKIEALEERIAGNSGYMESIMDELKELKRKASVFVGTDSLLKLNDEVKKDIVELNKLVSKVKLHSEKSEQIFIELKSGFAEYQKLSQIISTLDTSYSGIRTEVEKLKLDHSEVMDKTEFNDFKKTFNNKFALLDNALGEIERLKEEDDRISHLIETTLSVTRENKEDIADLAITIGDDHIKRVGDYEEQLNSLLGLIDRLAGEVEKLKEGAGIRQKKIMVPQAIKPLPPEKKIEKVRKKIEDREDIPVEDEPKKEE